MKKTVSIILALCIISLSICCVGAAEKAQVYINYYSFENDTIGEKPYAKPAVFAQGVEFDGNRPAKVENDEAMGNYLAASAAYAADGKGSPAMIYGGLKLPSLTSDFVLDMKFRATGTSNGNSNAAAIVTARDSANNDFMTLSSSRNLLAYTFKSTAANAGHVQRTGKYIYNEEASNKADTFTNPGTAQWHDLRVIFKSDGTKITGYEFFVDDMSKNLYEKDSFAPVKAAFNGDISYLLIGANVTDIRIGTSIAPSADGVNISGICNVGKTLTAELTGYAGSAEGVHQYTWYRCDSSDGSNAEAIEGAAEKSYTLTVDDAGKYIKVAAIPTDADGISGKPVTSAVSDIVTRRVLPSAEAKLTGKAKIGETLNLQYTYSHADNVAEGASSYALYSSKTLNFQEKAEVLKSSEEGSNGGSELVQYMLTDEDAGKYFRLEVTPVDANGNMGSIAYSDIIGPVTDENGGYITDNVIIMDNGTSASQEMTWGTYTENPKMKTSSAAAYMLVGKDNRWVSVAAGEKGAVRYQPKNVKAGLYKVECVRPKDSQAMNGIVYHGETEENRVINSSYGQDTMWWDLGTYSFTGSGNEYIEISFNNRTEGPQTFRVDAVRLTEYVMAEKSLLSNLYFTAADDRIRIDAEGFNQGEKELSINTPSGKLKVYAELNQADIAIKVNGTEITDESNEIILGSGTQIFEITAETSSGEVETYTISANIPEVGVYEFERTNVGEDSVQAEIYVSDNRTNAESRNVMYAAAEYDSATGCLSEVKLDKKAMNDNSRYRMFNVTLSKNNEIKTFLWNADTLEALK